MKNPEFVITKPNAGRPLSAFLKKQLQMRWTDVRFLIRNGQVRIDGQTCVDPSRNLRKGQKLSVDPTLPTEKMSQGRGQARGNPQRGERPKPIRTSGPRPTREPGQYRDAEEQPVIRYSDKHIVIVDKPHGLTTVRHSHEVKEFKDRDLRFLPMTLTDLLPGLLPRPAGPLRSGPSRNERIRAVHRLDKDTSGLLVFARTAEAESKLGKQMRSHAIDRKYMALVRGHPESQTIESELVRDRGDGRRGSSDNAKDGKRAITHVKVIEQIGDFALVECRLETGRTHQVRIHLGESGTPLCGERVYDRPLDGQPIKDTSGAARPMLHACFLAIEHPATGKEMQWTSGLPDDMKATLKALRQHAKTSKPRDEESVDPSSSEEPTQGKISDLFGKS